MLRGHLSIRHTFIALALALSACGQAEEKAGEANEPAAVDTEAPGAAPADDQAQFCAEVGRRVSAADCADLSALADQAQQGVAAFNAPNPMQRGDVHTLQLAISYAPTPEQIAAREEAERLERQRLNQGYDSPRPGGENSSTGATPAPPPAPTPGEVVDPLQGDTVQYTPLVGRFMRAELHGNGFEITPLSEPSQEVLQDSVTTWSWRVEAREGGQRALTLTTVVEGCTASGQCYPLRSTSQNYDVTVRVGLLGQAQDFLAAVPTWLQLAAGVLGGLAALVGAWFGLRNAFRKGRAGA